VFYQLPQTQEVAPCKLLPLKTHSKRHY
jgi:hypothetical protein